jgi:hypothetical protein
MWGRLLVLELASGLDLADGPFGCGIESVACLISPSAGVCDVWERADDRSNGSIHAQTSTPGGMSISRRRIPMSSLSYNHLWRVFTAIWDLVMSG